MPRVVIFLIIHRDTPYVVVMPDILPLPLFIIYSFPYAIMPLRHMMLTSPC